MGANEIGMKSPHANYMELDKNHYSNYNDYMR